MKRVFVTIIVLLLVSGISWAGVAQYHKHKATKLLEGVMTTGGRSQAHSLIAIIELLEEHNQLMRNQNEILAKIHKDMPR